ncbi:arylsulfatase [Maioricimonas sp. JC845]|uniref:arylsulfatase n=1 Tax=Maioricimonas sp. JC845 TaxID=3232138 RepID=UPI003458AC87
MKHALTILFLVVLAQVSSESTVAAESRPDIVVILSDDMGFSDIGCYGGEIETPHLNRLAEGGVRFTQFYNTGRCCPTRACLLTGLYPHQAGVGWMMTDRGHPGYRGDLNRQSATIAEVLRPAGYATYAVGKWHVTPHIRPQGPKHNWPLQRGFDRYYGTITGAGSFYDPGTLTRDNTMISPFADPEYQPETYYYTHAISDHAVRFIDEHVQQQPDRPLFMYVAYTAAHWPMHALEEDIAKYRGRYDDGYEPVRRRRLERVRELGLVSPDWEMAPQVGTWDRIRHKEWEARCMEVYAAMIDSMDQGIGRIIDALERSGRLENTLVLFMQDNGGCQEGIGRRGDWQRPVEPSLPVIPDDAIRLDVIPKQNRRGVPTLQGPDIMPGPEDTYIAYGINWANVSNTPFREYKHFVHEGGVSTPLIAHWPKQINRAGELVHEPAHLIDIMATCVDVAGAEYPQQLHDEPIQPMEGVSLLPAFAGEELDRDAIYWEHEGNRAIREGKWKLVAKENKPWELYDMETDRTELHDLSDRYPDLVARLEAKWQAWAERANVLPLGAWRAREKDIAFNHKQRRFELTVGADLKRTEAPYVDKRSLTIVAHLEDVGTRGVIVAQGGSSAGYALYVQRGKLHFATRHGGKLSVVSCPAPTGDGVVTVELAHNGTVTMRQGDQPLGKGMVPGPLTTMPLDGLQVGEDATGAVGDYSVPFAFDGKLSRVVIEVGDANPHE